MPQRKPQLGANGRDEFSQVTKHASSPPALREVVEETLQHVEPLPRQNTLASSGPARNLKHNNVIDGESPVRALQVPTIILPASSVCNDSAEHCADARAPSCFKVQKSSRTARSGRHGLSFPDRGQAIFPGCAARALKASLENGPTERSNIGSNDVAADALH